MSGSTYSFLDINAGIVGPGGAFPLANGAGPAEEGITITPTGPIGGMQIGADGNGQHSLYADHSGKVVVRLLKTSPVNAQLSQLYEFQVSSGAFYGQNTLTIQDVSRGDVITCQQAAFAKAPDLHYSKEAGFNEWEFNALRITRTLGNL